MCMGVSIINENHRRPEPGAGKRHRHSRSSERSAHNVHVKTAGTESVTRKCADKKVPDTQEWSNARMYTEPKDTVITKGTDNRAHAHTQKKGTDTIIGTETGNVMAQGR